MAAKQISELLKDLKKAGADIIDAGGDQNESIESLIKRSKLAESTIDSLNVAPQSFGAWVSWTKSF